MQASDKIYVAVYPNYDLDGEHLADDWTDHPVQDSENIAYIRKDALLELAKAKHMELDPPQNERDFGRIEAVEELIDKINSL